MKTTFRFFVILLSLLLSLTACGEAAEIVQITTPTIKAFPILLGEPETLWVGNFYIKALVRCGRNLNSVEIDDKAELEHIIGIINSAQLKAEAIVERAAGWSYYIDFYPAEDATPVRYQILENGIRAVHSDSGGALEFLAQGDFALWEYVELLFSDQ